MAYKIVNMMKASMYHINAPYAMSPNTLTIHETGNNATARNEVAYMNSNYNYTSYHVAIDDKEAVQAIPLNRNAWHAGDGQGAGNRRSISIEICYNKDNGFYGAISARMEKAIENTALYAAYVLHQYGWGVDRLRQHWDWSRKNCPQKIRQTGRWQWFKNRVQAHLNAIKKGSKAASKPVKANKPKPAPKKTVAKVPSKKVRNRASWGWHWSGSFKVTANSGIAVYRTEPRIKAKNLVNKASFLADNSWVNFDHIFMKDGYWWIRFKYAAKGASTAYFFAPIGKKKSGVGFATANKRKELWGTVTKLNSNEKTSGVTNWKKYQAVK